MGCVYLIGPHMSLWTSSKGSFSIEEDVEMLSLLCLERIQISQLQSFSFIIGRPITIECF